MTTTHGHWNPIISEAESRLLQGRAHPVGMVQPFDMRFTSDDIHVIAYFSGHARYEAVEAMICRRGSSGPTVRAILTSHDQTQVDHVNEWNACVAAQAFDGRRTVYRDIEVREEGSPTRPCVSVLFLSFLDEPILLRVQAASLPDPSRGGLTDPGRHAPKSSLPLMWRGKSCLAGPGSTVAIDHVTYALEERVRTPTGFVGLSGFYTETHQMGVMRASTLAYEIVQEPSQINLGSAWIYMGSDGQETRCVVTEMPASRLAIVTTRCGLRTERSLMEFHGLFLQPLRVESLGKTEAGSGFALQFLSDGSFAMEVAGNQQLVTGLAVHRQEGNDDAVFELSPQAPTWAISRNVKVQTSRLGKTVKVTTTIG